MYNVKFLYNVESIAVMVSDLPNRMQISCDKRFTDSFFIPSHFYPKKKMKKKKPFLEPGIKIGNKNQSISS